MSINNVFYQVSQLAVFLADSSHCVILIVSILATLLGFIRLVLKEIYNSYESNNKWNSISGFRKWSSTAKTNPHWAITCCCCLLVAFSPIQSSTLSLEDSVDTLMLRIFWSLLLELLASFRSLITLLIFSRMNIFTM